jgi:hypothetical protein
MKKQTNTDGLRPRGRVGLTTILFACLVCMAATRAPGQSVAPPFSGSYALTNLGGVNGVPSPYGGLILKVGDSNTLLIGGSANNAAGAIYSIGLVRGTGGHITGFSGTAKQFCTAPFIDGGLTYGPGGVLYFVTFPDNMLGQIKPGSTVPDKFIDLTALGVASSTGGLNFVPTGFPGAGGIRITSYNGGGFYSGLLTADGTGTFDLSNVMLLSTIADATQAEGFIYVPSNSPGFTSPAILLNEYRNGRVSALNIDANGVPDPTTRQDFVTGLTGAEGAFIDPLTGDFIFATFGGGDQLIAVSGFVPAPGTLNNISTRLEVGTGDNVLIGGFVVQGGAPKRVLIRATGPSLIPLGIPNALVNPRLELHDAAGVIGMNDDWQTTQIGGVVTEDQVAAIQGTTLAPSDPAECAIVATLSPGSYTAIVQGVNSGVGVGIVEVYDVNPTIGLLGNISTRGFVQTMDNIMIGGFIIASQPTRVIIRAIGPSLSQFGVPNVIGNPQLELHDASSTLARNDDWQTTEIFGIVTSDQVAEIQASGFMPTDSSESAIIATLQPGSYTAIVSGVSSATGNALVEVYRLQ